MLSDLLPLSSAVTPQRVYCALQHQPPFTRVPSGAAVGRHRLATVNCSTQVYPVVQLRTYVSFPSGREAIPGREAPMHACPGAYHVERGDPIAAAIFASLPLLFFFLGTPPSRLTHSLPCEVWSGPELVSVLVTGMDGIHECLILFAASASGYVRVSAASEHHGVELLIHHSMSGRDPGALQFIFICQPTRALLQGYSVGF